MIVPRAIATAILLACIGIVTIASIEPIAGNMIGQGMKDQGMIISCSPNMDCKAIMPINASMKQPFMACMMMMIMPTNEAEQNKSVTATEVVVSGSTTVGPLGILCADAFNAAQKDYHVSVAQTGTGAGITALAQGQADVAMASREVTADEKTKYGNTFMENLIGYDGIAIIVSKPVYDAGVKALTKDQVKKIYAGNITNWKDLGGPDAQIYAVSREQGSGPF